jgi:glycosyltransferase involved in cell wall biosynthesis
MDNRVILFLIDTLNTGGAERSLLDIVSRFKRYTPIVCYIYPGDTLKTEFEARGVRTIALNIPGPYNLNKAQHAVSQVVEQLKPVAIHSSLFKSDIVSRRVARRYDILLINSMVNNSYHPSRFQGAGIVMKLKLKLIQWYDAWTSRHVNFFISNSEAIKTSNSRALRIPLEKIKVIYRGRSAANFSIEDKKVQQLRDELGIGKNKKVLLNVSRLIHRKGQLELIRAFQAIVRENPDALLLIAGEGPYRDTLEKEIQRLQLSACVKLLGNRKDVPALMKIADCFVFPSHYEGLPGALIEAMFAQLPIVASRIEENVECVNDNTAYLFKVRDEADLARAVGRVLTNPQESINKAQQAYIEASEKFEISKITACYEATYDELLARRMHTDQQTKTEEILN